MGLGDKPAKYWANKTRLSAFKAAFDGFKSLWENEFNFRIHLGVTLITLIMGVIFKISLFEWFVVILLIGQVLALEMINSAIETVVDLVVETKWHPLAKRSKDISAAAVTLSAIISVIIGALIFGPRILAVLN